MPRATLINSSVTRRPDFVAIKRFESAASFVMGFTYTYSGSPSLCSALKLPGLPRITDEISSGI
jgi:hypothetical protein